MSEDLEGHHRARRVLVTLLVLLAGVVVYSLIAVGDTVGDEATVAQSTAEAQAYAQGEDAARRELAPRVAEAYAQGQRDAVLSVQGLPEGLALAQACFALQQGAQR
jgi:hypothetical protein